MHPPSNTHNTSQRFVSKRFSFFFVTTKKKHVRMEKSDSQLNVVYRDDMWLNQFPLTDKNVILYFRHCASTFYERGCDNEDLYQRHGEPRPPLFAPTFAQDKLRETKGVQYETVPFRKHLIHLVGQAEFNALPQFIRGNAGHGSQHEGSGESESSSVSKDTGGNSRIGIEA